MLRLTELARQLSSSRLATVARLPARQDGHGFAAQPQDLVLTMFGAFLSPRTASVWSGGLVEALGLFGSTPGASRIALARLVRRGLTERTRQGRLVFYRLTPRCHELLAEGDERIFALGEGGEGDEQWTLVWHSLPDAQKIERTRLGRRLRFLGFGQLQDGTWVSPRDQVSRVQGIVAQLGVEHAVAVLLGYPANDKATEWLVERAWPLAEVERRYRDFAREYAKSSSRVRLSEQEAFEVCTRMLHIFRGFASMDPELPARWAPYGPARERAKNVFEQGMDRLRDPAARHFAKLTHSGS